MTFFIFRIMVSKASLGQAVTFTPLMNPYNGNTLLRIETQDVDDALRKARDFFSVVGTPVVEDINGESVPVYFVGKMTESKQDSATPDEIAFRIHQFWAVPES